ncbi:MAG: hypothetical protein LBC68_09540 [Prevotellaceae bacterium]|jgi:hypothetical protein|nr:hypothetical protein [Prevotellaceae bacterium]
MILFRHCGRSEASQKKLKYSVRNYRSVENNTKTCMSRGVAAVFQVSDSNPRERQDVITFATEVVLLENKV